MNINFSNNNDQIKLGSETIDGRGYILDEPYIARFFDLQSPSRITYSMRANGQTNVSKPDNFRYCELGSGRGMTTSILASVYPDAEFVGIDLNPEHIEYAESLADASGLENISFLQADFVEASNSISEPFDYITIHGVYSWVDTDVRNQMFEFVKQHLKDDGIAYISYNAYPGWSAKEPLWRLINKHIETVSGNSVDKIRNGIDFLDFLAGTNAPYFAENKVALDHLEFLKSEDLRYISHEFCNRNFAPVYCSDAFDHAAKFGLEFAAQAESCYNLSGRCLPGQYLGYIEQFEDPKQKEIWTSLLRNDEFRTDLFVKGKTDPAALEDSELWDMAFTNIVPVRDIGSEIDCDIQTVSQSDPMVSALIETCELGELTLSELIAEPTLARFSPKAVLELAQILELSGLFAFLDSPILSEEIPIDANWQFGHLSYSPLLQAQLSEESIPYLPAPVLGTAIRMKSIDAVALISINGNDETNAVKTFVSVMNTEFPGFLDFEIDAEWAAGFLYDMRENWGPILAKLGSIKPA